ncbi:flagellar hook-length control protein FliK [Duganella sp. 3397]|uniref:flagellar hook-length control protein FliK n=1 Tax=Duganella sp. 3397 TaxID=2817732 RepID=UPI002865B595|nr:flagellar hook-length control protein FliK [Duganella sp. 3397]MDR7051560.1 flagellar hook-length control protein FliK [Duganella sp. 3397]
MQNAPLPSLNATTATAATNKPKANLGAGSSNDAFRQALSQQLDQRQAVKQAETKTVERQSAARATAPKPNAAPKPPQQDKTADRNIQSKPAEKQGVSTDEAGNIAKAGHADDINTDDRAASDAQAAQATDPIADMLALVAAFNQRADGDATSAEADAALASGGAAASVMDAATLAALTAEQASAVADGPADIAQATDAQVGSAEFKAALGRAADGLPAPAAPVPDHLEADSSLTPLRVELASQAAPAEDPQENVASTGKGAAGLALPLAAHHGAATGDHSAASIQAADVTSTGGVAVTGAPLKAELGHFSQQLAVARGEAKAETDAALAARDGAPDAVTPLGATVAAATPEMAKVAVPAATLYSRVGTPAWDQQLGQKVIFMAAGGEHSATMELNPPDLGPLQVVLSVNKDQATAAFTSAAPEVRQALEAALPKLREMMGEAGIALGNATVSAGADQNAGQRAANDGNTQRGRSGRSSDSEDSGNSVAAAAGAATARTARVPNGAVDTFA